MLVLASCLRAQHSLWSQECGRAREAPRASFRTALPVGTCFLRWWWRAALACGWGGNAGERKHGDRGVPEFLAGQFDTRVTVDAGGTQLCGCDTGGANLALCGTEIVLERMQNSCKLRAHQKRSQQYARQQAMFSIYGVHDVTVNPNCSSVKTCRAESSWNAVGNATCNPQARIKPRLSDGFAARVFPCSGLLPVSQLVQVASCPTSQH